MIELSKIVLVGLVAVVLVGCGNSGNEGQEQAPAQVAAPVTVPVAEATQQDLPGIYSGTLPCGDCKGVITKLELTTDGSYKVNEVFDGKSGDGSTLDSDGKWTFDQASHRLTLDPTAQDWQDRQFEVVSVGVLRPLDGNGDAYSTEGANDLKLNK